MKIKAISKDFANREKAKQTRLLGSPVFEGARSGGYAMLKDKSTGEVRPFHFPFIIVPEDSIKNLFAPIRQDALDYFERYDITWWNQTTDRYFPTGQVLSSQNHCLNHLFALRKNPDAVLAMINTLSPGVQFEKVLPSPVDNKEWYHENGKNVEKPNYICFEFALANKALLGERGNTRGAKCTSVDALVYAQSTDGRKFLIPIEWKYTEAYKPLRHAEQKSIDRYPKLLDDLSNFNEWLEMYEYDPYYEFARQEIFMEQIIRKHPSVLSEPLLADEFLHVVVCPEEHTELRAAIVDFKDTLRYPWKFECKTPQELLAPLADAPFTDNSDIQALLEYLNARYWGVRSDQPFSDEDYFRYGE